MKNRWDEQFEDLQLWLLRVGSLLGFIPQMKGEVNWSLATVSGRPIDKVLTEVQALLPSSPPLSWWQQVIADPWGERQTQAQFLQYVALVDLYHTVDAYCKGTPQNIPVMMTFYGQAIALKASLNAQLPASLRDSLAKEFSGRQLEASKVLGATQTPSLWQRGKAFFQRLFTGLSKKVEAHEAEISLPAIPKSNPLELHSLSQRILGALKFTPVDTSFSLLSSENQQSEVSRTVEKEVKHHEETSPLPKKQAESLQDLEEKYAAMLQSSIEKYVGDLQKQAHSLCVKLGLDQPLKPTEEINLRQQSLSTNVQQFQHRLSRHQANLWLPAGLTLNERIKKLEVLDGEVQQSLKLLDHLQANCQKVFEERLDQWKSRLKKAREQITFHDNYYQRALHYFGEAKLAPLMAERIDDLQHWQQQQATFNERLASLGTYTEQEIEAAYIDLVQAAEKVVKSGEQLFHYFSSQLEAKRTSDPAFFHLSIPDAMANQCRGEEYLTNLRMTH